MTQPPRRGETSLFAHVPLFTTLLFYYLLGMRKLGTAHDELPTYDATSRFSKSNISDTFSLQKNYNNYQVKTPSGPHQPIFHF